MSRFDTTQWSVVLGTQGSGDDARAALESLCRTYRPPVLAFIRSRGYSVDVAEDLTQSFFTQFLERGSYAKADPSRGRFRAYLLTAIQHFLIDAAAEVHTNGQPAGITAAAFAQLDPACASDVHCGAKEIPSSSPRLG